MATPWIMKMESLCQTTMSYEVITHLAMRKLFLFAQNITHLSDGHNWIDVKSTFFFLQQQISWHAFLFQFDIVVWHNDWHKCFSFPIFYLKIGKFWLEKHIPICMPKTWFTKFFSKKISPNNVIFPPKKNHC